MNVKSSQIRRAQNGDDIALNEVFGEVLDFLTDFVGAHIESIADRDDVVQRTVKAIFEKFNTFRCGTSFDDWVSSFVWRRINRYYDRGWDDRVDTNQEITFARWLGDVEFDEIEGMIDPDRIIS